MLFSKGILSIILRDSGCSNIKGIGVSASRLFVLPIGRSCAESLRAVSLLGACRRWLACGLTNFVAVGGLGVGLGVIPYL